MSYVKQQLHEAVEALESIGVPRDLAEMLVWKVRKSGRALSEKDICAALATATMHMQVKW